MGVGEIAIVGEAHVSDSQDAYAEDVTPSPVSIPRGTRETVLLQEGETLRILAGKLFGSREFWVYIYLENREIIGDPNRVPAGIRLQIPDPEQYQIDSADPVSVERARRLGDDVIQPLTTEVIRQSYRVKSPC